MKGFKKDGKFIPTGSKHVGVGKAQIKPHAEVPSSIGNEMLIRKKESTFEDSKTDDHDDLDEQFGQFVTVDKGYSDVFGDNNEFYKVGIQNGVGSDELSMIESNLGYVIDNVEPANEYFIHATFRKKDVNEGWTKLSKEEIRIILNNINYDNVDYGTAGSIENKLHGEYKKRKVGVIDY